MTDFLISYTRNDRPWAAWIAWQLEQAGYTTLLDVWDFRPGDNFVLAMQQATEQAERTLLVLSPDYLTALYPQPEWAAAFANDPTGTEKKLVPVRVRACEPPGMLQTLIYIDLVDLDEAAARDGLLAGVRQSRAKPPTAPGFPGTDSVEQPPLFPGIASPSALSPNSGSGAGTQGGQATHTQVSLSPTNQAVLVRLWAWSVRNRQWVWSGIGTALLIALVSYFLAQKPETTAGRDINRINGSPGTATIQTDKGTIVIQQGEQK